VSDLQCPATFVLVAVDERVLGQERLHELASCLRGRRVAAVYAAPMPFAAEPAEFLSGKLRLAVREHAALAVAAPEAASGVATTDLGSLRTALAEIADEHRGETVLVVAPVPALSRALPGMGRNLSASYARARPLVHGCTVEMRVDGDGWVLDSWMGEAAHG
jgi:broad specificity phosphatase PhoE